VQRDESPIDRRMLRTGGALLLRANLDEGYGGVRRDFSPRGW